MNVSGEGIETREQRDLLLRLGAIWGRGGCLAVQTRRTFFQRSSRGRRNLRLSGAPTEMNLLSNAGKGYPHSDLLSLRRCMMAHPT